MSVNDLKPANTNCAHATAIKAFNRFLSAESTSMEHVKALIVADPSRAGDVLVTLMDKFALHQTREWWQQLTIGAGGVFFIRFIRVKTSDEQTLSLFPDEDFATCPLLALALALITQESPCAALLNNLPSQSKDVPVS
uniref:Uncharacterized protein n=1 Tax=Phytophthora ramorum TaxID=164328 RepID=H3HAJ6_PHYRM